MRALHVFAGAGLGHRILDGFLLASLRVAGFTGEGAFEYNLIPREPTLHLLAPTHPRCFTSTNGAQPQET
jgi:hypothetical protein